MLPLSRNETHDSSTSLKPSTVDDIQDCIIRLESQRTAPSGDAYGAPAFVPSKSAAAYAAGQLPFLNPGGGGSIVEWRFTAEASFPSILLCSPIVSAGRILTSIKWEFSKGGSFANMGLRVLSQLEGVETSLDALFDTSSDSGIVTLTREFNHPLVDGEKLLLKVEAGATAHRFVSAIVTHRAPPAP